MQIAEDTKPRSPAPSHAICTLFPRGRENSAQAKPEAGASTTRTPGDAVTLHSFLRVKGKAVHRWVSGAGRGRAGQPEPVSKQCLEEPPREQVKSVRDSSNPRQFSILKIIQPRGFKKKNKKERGRKARKARCQAQRGS